MNENAMLPHNFIRYKFSCLQLMISGLKTKDDIQDGCQNKLFEDFNCLTIYLYCINICAS